MRERERAGTGGVDLTHRVGQIEAVVEGMRQQVIGLGSDMTSLVTKVDRLGDMIQSSAKTPWGTLLTGASVILGFVSIVGSVIAYGMNDKIAGIVKHGDRLESRQDESDRIRLRWVEILGAQIEKVSALQDRTSQLDETLQREMRLNGEKLKSETDALDHRLQMEMRLLRESDEARITANANGIKDLQEWRNIRQGILTEQMGRLDERLKALESKERH